MCVCVCVWGDWGGWSADGLWGFGRARPLLTGFIGWEDELVTLYI